MAHSSLWKPRRSHLLRHSSIGWWWAWHWRRSRCLDRRDSYPSSIRNISRYKSRDNALMYSANELAWQFKEQGAWIKRRNPPLYENKFVQEASRYSWARKHWTQSCNNDGYLNFFISRFCSPVFGKWWIFYWYPLFKFEIHLRNEKNLRVVRTEQKHMFNCRYHQRMYQA